MFWRFNTRNKESKVHRYWSVVENRRLRAGHTTQRTVLYRGEINDPQQAAWRKSLDALNEATQLTEHIYLFPEDRDIPSEVLNGLQVKLSELTLQPPRVFGDGWLACRLWNALQLGSFWRERLPDGKVQVPWFKVLELLTVRHPAAQAGQALAHPARAASHPSASVETRHPPAQTGRRAQGSRQSLELCQSHRARGAPTGDP